MSTCGPIGPTCTQLGRVLDDSSRWVVFSSHSENWYLGKDEDE